MRKTIAKLIASISILFVMAISAVWFVSYWFEGTFSTDRNPRIDAVIIQGRCQVSLGYHHPFRFEGNGSASCDIPRHDNAPWRWYCWESSTAPMNGWMLDLAGMELGYSHNFRTGSLNYPPFIWKLRFPLIYPLLAFIVTYVLSIKSLRRTPRIGCCPNCGYDLRATPIRCPECGHLFQAKKIIDSRAESDVI